MRGPWLVALTFGMYSGQWLAVVGFLPSIYAAAGVSGALLGVLTALAAAVNIVGNMASGRLLQRGWAPRATLWLGFGAMALGSTLAFAAFTEGQLVDVCGTSKGKGFQGVVKRFRVAGGPATHGSMFHRRIGSVGMRQTPGRVWKNQAMPGHMGTDSRTVQNLRVVKIIAEKNLILVKGAIPGANGDDVVVRSAIKGQRAVVAPAAAPAPAKDAKPAKEAKAAAKK